MTVLYHGTDVDSALDILNNGLNEHRLLALQGRRPTQLGPGWYVALDSEVAWFFAALAPGNVGRGYTVIEMELADSDFDYLLEEALVTRHELINVPFLAEQYWIDRQAFHFLNAQAVFRPHRR